MKRHHSFDHPISPGPEAAPRTPEHLRLGRRTRSGSPWPAPALAARDLQAAYLEWCDDVSFDGIALTLTFKPSWQRILLTQQIAESTVAHFLHRVNRKVGGRSQEPESKLRVIAVREGGIGIGNKRLHYHLKVEVPEAWTHEDFCRLCLATWRKLDWASIEQNRASANSDKHWVSYILKLRDKADYATAIDINNTNLRSP